MARGSAGRTAPAQSAERPQADPAAPPPQPPTPADPPPGPAGSSLTRVTINLNRQAARALEDVSEATGYSKTDTINRALQIYALINEIMQRNGNTLQIRHEDGTLERIHIL